MSNFVNTSIHQPQIRVLLIVLPSITDNQHESSVKLENPSKTACVRGSIAEVASWGKAGQRHQGSRSHGPLGGFRRKIIILKSTVFKGTWDTSQGNSEATLPPVYSFKKHVMVMSFEAIWKLYGWNYVSI